MAYTNASILTAVDASTFEGGTTSWATDGGNTTLSVVTGQFLSGTYSMRLTATAAGTVTAFSPRIAVTGSTPYVARVPIRTSAATAGRTGQGTITWYDAPSGGSVISTATVTGVPISTGIGWFPINYVVVSGTAPASAKSAVLRFSVTGLTAAEYVNTDDVHFGVSTPVAGNLLDYATQSMESSTSGWQVTLNGTVARANGTLATGAGFYVAGVTSTAAGVVDFRNASLIPVTAGTEYAAYAWVNSPQALDVGIQIFWYDVGNANIGTSGLKTTTFAANDTTLLAAVGVAPAGAVNCKLDIRPVATAAAQTVYIDEAVIRVATNVAGNLLTYDEYSSESTLPAWTVTNASAPVRSYLTTSNTDGFYALKMTPSAAGLITGTLNRLIPVTPGVVYKVGAVLWRHNANTANTITSSFRTRVDWYDGAGNLFLADNPDQFYSFSLPTDWVSHKSSETRQCPTGAAFAKVTFEIDHPTNGADAYYVDVVQLSPSIAAYTLSVDNDRGCVTYTNSSVPAYGTSGTVSVYRVHQDGSMVPLRGYGMEYARAPFTQTPIVIEDYEAPVGESVWYKADWYDAGGALALMNYSQSVDTPILADPDYVWVKSPGIPAVNTRVMMESPVKWNRAARSSVYEIVGRRNPIHITGTRGGRTSSLSLLVWDEESNDLFDALLDAGLPVLIQATPGYGIRGNLYLSVGDVDCEPVTSAANQPGWRWTLAVTEIDRPAGGLQGSAIRTWQTIANTYADWTAVQARGTWQNILMEG
ncbi:hypothetical protein [Streptomyces avermitilis]|uniref:hypothetical protein n=1 Tax=Streptomyces avermitilis TaxID=33903 RepID=UPI00381A562D